MTSSGQARATPTAGATETTSPGGPAERAHRTTFQGSKTSFGPRSCGTSTYFGRATGGPFTRTSCTATGEAPGAPTAATPCESESATADVISVLEGWANLFGTSVAVFALCRPRPDHGTGPSGASSLRRGLQSSCRTGYANPLASPSAATHACKGA